MNKENYIRKSHSFTKEALDHLGILSRYMGDIGESAVLRYLIINEIRKVPAFKPNRELSDQWGHNQELQRQLERLMNKSKEDEPAELSRDMLINRLVGKNFGGHEKAEAEIKALDDAAISRVIGEDEE
jgi:hypothetical protein